MSLLHGLISGDWRVDKGNTRPVRIDSVTHALHVIDYPHHEVHAGNHFHASYSVASIGALTTPDDLMTLTFFTPNTTKWLHFAFDATSASGALLRFIEGGTGGGESPTGTISVFNSNRNSSVTSGILSASGGTAGAVSYDATLVTGGTTLVEMYIGALGIGNSFTSSEERSEQEWVLKQNTQYQISLYNTATVPGTIQLSWYEHANRG